MPHTQLMEERLRFLQIDHNTLSELRQAKEFLEPAMDELLDRFYSHLLGEPDLRALFADEDAIDRARSAQKNHWLKTLFEGKFDNTYFEKAGQIGRAHFRVGLTPNWYIAGYCQMLGQFIELISNEYSNRGKPATQIIQAVSRAIFLDIDLVIHCYLDAKDSYMRQILRHATEFTADVTALGDELSASATQINATAETLSAHAGNAAEQISELLAQAAQLTRQTEQLDARLKELQFRDKLYIDESTPESGTISRLKALVLGKK
ncbi:MAG: protoglobin domain-containing protein [Gammaproteobacteria bacterium]|nr:protoglobin domain-containing protein [Gammaproteobacteria bacterium]